VTSDLERQARLAAAYATVEDIDLWVGALNEDHAPGVLVGETMSRVLGDQFSRLRDGDRFWYQSYLPDQLVSLVESQTLALIIQRNTAIGRELPRNVFQVGSSREHHDRRSDR